MPPPSRLARRLVRRALTPSMTSMTSRGTASSAIHPVNIGSDRHIPSLSTSREPTEGTEQGPRYPGNAFEFISESGSSGGMEGVGGRGHAVRDEIERDACYLADAFNSPSSLEYFRFVVSVVPRHLVFEAFARARDVPRSAIRRSRAAIFTSLLRAEIGRRRPRRYPSPARRAGPAI